ncbi:MAG: hypothetical protein JXB47_02870 [Anaerolineae bacterium]|nr:hypothetical protein [Anaerolineae bacterium]
MKKSLMLALDDAELIELLQILTDDDAEALLAFFREQRLRAKVRDLLEGG